MLKNVRISVKLIGISVLILIVALGSVVTLSVTRSTAGLTRLGRDQMMVRPRSIAKVIDKVYAEELRMARSLADDPDIIAAVAAIDARGAKSAAAEIATANRKLAAFGTDPELSVSYEGVNANARDGIVAVSSLAAGIGRDLSERDYVKKALAGQPAIGAVVLSKVSGKPISPIAVPISSGGAVVGAVTMILNIDFLNTLIADETVGKTGYTTIVDNRGLVIAHPNRDLILTMNVLETPGMERFGKDMVAGKAGVDSYTLKGVHKTAGFAPVAATGWSVSLAMEDSDDAFLGQATSLRNSVISVSIIILLVAAVIYFLFSLTITRPLAKGVKFAERIASGDFTQVLAISQRDEIGKLAAALNAMSRRLAGVVATIQSSAQQVASSTEQINASAQKLAEGAQSQASTLEETSASVEELTASVDQVAEHAHAQAEAVTQGTSSMDLVQQSIREVSKNLEEIATLAGTSVDNALEGAQAVSQVVEGINLIAGSSEKIGGIVTVISEIADQTNLLALNAAIEAARAGEHGRGFAVVADEVSKLADRSSSSTKEIEGLIKESVKNVAKGVETAQGSQSAMEHIRDASRTVREMIGALSEATRKQVEAVTKLSGALANVSEMSQSISAATAEQTSNSKQVAKAVENVNDVTQQAAAAAEEMSAATQHLMDMARRLSEVTSQFRIGAASDPSETGVIVKSEEIIP